MAKILLVNGPNLNLLGQREPEIYGATTLGQIEDAVQKIVSANGHQLECIQSNHEGELVDWLQSKTDSAFLLINAASLTHTSIALRDTLSFLKIPFVEIHISNVYCRETFRHKSYLSDIAIGVIAGLGASGYDAAAQFAVTYLQNN